MEEQAGATKVARSAALLCCCAAIETAFGPLRVAVRSERTRLAVLSMVVVCGRDIFLGNEETLGAFCAKERA